MKYSQLLDILFDLQADTDTLEALKDRAAGVLCLNGTRCKEVFDVAYEDTYASGCYDVSVARVTLEKVDMKNYPNVAAFVTAVARQYVDDMCDHIYTL